MLNVLAQAVPVFDWTNFGVTAIQAIVPVVTTLAIWAGRALLVKTPRVVIPIVHPDELVEHAAVHVQQ